MKVDATKPKAYNFNRASGETIPYQLYWDFWFLSVICLVISLPNSSANSVKTVQLSKQIAFIFTK